MTMANRASCRRPDSPMMLSHTTENHVSMPSARSRIMALAIAIIMFVAFALSPIAISRELHHNCAGTDCAICAELVGNLSLTRGGSTPASTTPAATLVLIIVLAVLGEVRFSYAPITLVSLKVRLDD